MRRAENVFRAREADVLIATSTDLVSGGSANAYEYGDGDPVDNYGLDGKSWRRMALRRGAVSGGVVGPVFRF